MYDHCTTVRFQQNEEKYLIDCSGKRARNPAGKEEKGSTPAPSGLLSEKRGKIFTNAIPERTIFRTYTLLHHNRILGEPAG